MAGEQLARQESGDFYPREQYRADVSSDEVLDHHPPENGGRWRRVAAHYGTDHHAVPVGIRTAEGVRLLSADRMDAVLDRYNILCSIAGEATLRAMVYQVVSSGGKEHSYGDIGG